MNIKKCERGHFYNGDKYQTCPHCKEAEQAKDIPQDEEAKPIQGYQIDENMPEWARKSVQKAVNKGVLSGTDEGWNLQYDDLRVIVWLDRLGLLE